MQSPWCNRGCAQTCDSREWRLPNASPRNGAFPPRWATQGTGTSSSGVSAPHTPSSRRRGAEGGPRAAAHLRRSGGWSPRPRWRRWRRWARCCPSRPAGGAGGSPRPARWRTSRTCGSTTTRRSATHGRASAPAPPPARPLTAAPAPQPAPPSRRVAPQAGQGGDGTRTHGPAAASRRTCQRLPRPPSSQARSGRPPGGVPRV